MSSPSRRTCGVFLSGSILVAAGLWIVLRRKRHGTTISKEDVHYLRRTYFSSSNSVSYANTGPLMIVKVRQNKGKLMLTSLTNLCTMYSYSAPGVFSCQGRGTYLYDESGSSYLDTRNNVAHCGHSHPRITEAIRSQMAKLTTNTRYLHPVTSELAERLANSFPDPLDTVFFVNSGSEANDLALRLAGVWTGERSRNTIVVDSAYHGHTLAVLELSSSKFAKSAEYELAPPAASAPFATPGPHIWQVSCPDVFRGKYKDPDTAGALYAAEVEEACKTYLNKGEKVRAFVVESGISVGGAILPPKGYLRACAEAVRKAGGLYVADEVQTGFGRLGSCYWAFQYHGEDEVVPDIVTVGKAFGNGTPLAAVITSKKVAAAFEDQHVEYFNTFGGNPVSTTAGLAVMNVVRDEKLQENALHVGGYLKEGLRMIQKDCSLIGDVRGSGFFIGVEFVRNRDTQEPASIETSWLCSHMKTEYQILTSIDGPYQNILNFKPPMVFSRKNADRLLSCLRQALIDDIKKVDLSVVSATPT